MIKHKHWNRADDEQLISAAYEGLTQEGIARRFGMTTSRVSNRFHKLGVEISFVRRAFREGISVTQILDNSPLYIKKIGNEGKSAIRKNSQLDRIEMLLTEVMAVLNKRGAHTELDTLSGGESDVNRWRA